MSLSVFACPFFAFFAPDSPLSSFWSYVSQVPLLSSSCSALLKVRSLKKRASPHLSSPHPTCQPHPILSFCGADRTDKWSGRSRFWTRCISRTCRRPWCPSGALSARAARYFYDSYNSSSVFTLLYFTTSGSPLQSQTEVLLYVFTRFICLAVTRTW